MAFFKFTTVLLSLLALGEADRTLTIGYGPPGYQDPHSPGQNFNNQHHPGHQGHQGGPEVVQHPEIIQNSQGFQGLGPGIQTDQRQIQFDNFHGVVDRVHDHICNYNNEFCVRGLGQLSRCQPRPQGRCECYDTISSGKKETIHIDGRCYYARRYNDYCDNHLDYCINSRCINGRCSSSTKISPLTSPLAILSILVAVFGAKFSN